MKRIEIMFDNGKELVLENIKFENLEKSLMYGRPTVVILDNKNEVVIDTSKITYMEIANKEVEKC